MLPPKSAAVDRSFHAYFTDHPVINAEQVRASDLGFNKAVHNKIREAGIYKSTPKGYCLSCTHGSPHRRARGGPSPGPFGHSGSQVFNYATGPIEMDPADLTAMVEGPRNSHSAEGQELVTATIANARAVLDVPDDFDLFILPGSIRQTLADLSLGLVETGTRCLALDTGYWGEFIADLAESRGGKVVRVDDLDETSDAFDLVTAVHMETETGLMQPLESLKAHRARGAITLVDSACTIPFHPLDWDLADVVVLGSHKCLCAAPGLGIVVIRSRVTLGYHWPLSAYRADASSRRNADDARPTPLVTYPIELLAALNSSLTPHARRPPVPKPTIRGRKAAACEAL